MMARNWIVVGDPTSSGGSVVTGSPFTDIDGIPVARVTDQATCPSHKGAYPIVDGDDTLIVDGQPVALHGSSLSCGCKVLSAQQVRVFVEAGGGGSARGGLATATVAAGAAVASAIATGTSQQPDAEDALEYDEALRFCSESGEPLAGVRYTLHLANDETCSGVTDDRGVTERICTCACEEIIRAVLLPPDGAEVCCSLHGCSEQDEVVLELEGVKMNDQGVGDSVVEVKATGHKRDLTAGELAIARQLFGESVDYSKVKIHNHGYWMFFGLQQKHTAVTPNGQMYFPAAIYRDDFSISPEDMALFVHEMVHVWQRQLGYAVRWNGLSVSSRGASAYQYRIAADTTLADYNMEQQGDIVSDYYMIVVLGEPRYARGSRGTPEQLRQVLADFLRDPSSRANLPR
ncbi:PAAR domain-containing protein [Luteimonas sp. JM171]|uniref:PAAR domain-containing protein n=1 Tax=Luteimonas sp. JM171 TaxID=1896164 RepID=UPI001F292F8D|nr:PAAR domain-containing protein [Luteimonas sp. JM171]